MKKLLEIACFNLPSVVIAQDAGADRIEFCKDYHLGGTSPQRNDILSVRELTSLPIHCIIRPRGGNFVYDKEESEIMCDEIRFCLRTQINGVVIGAQTNSHVVDVELCKRFIDTAEHMPVTFHRAIDDCKDIYRSIESLIQLGFKRVLTSGGEGNAITNCDKLKKLQREFGQEIIIMPGGGIRAENIDMIMNKTKCDEFHSAAIINNIVLPDESQIHLMLKKLQS